jgi:hypothetical protein
MLPKLPQATFRRAVNHTVIRGDDLLRAEKANVSSNLTNYGEKERNINCKNIEVKFVGQYSLQILIGAKCKPTI